MAVAGSLIVEMGMDIARLQSDVEKARVSIGSVDQSVAKLEKSFDKLTNVYEYANQGLRRMQNLLTGMAFGFATGLVLSFADSIFNAGENTEKANKKTKDLTDSILKQADAWGLLPLKLKEVTNEQVAMYNISLKIAQLEAEKGIMKTIEQLDKLKEFPSGLEKGLLTHPWAIADAKNMEMLKDTLEKNFKVVELERAKNVKAILEHEQTLKNYQKVLSLEPATLEEVAKNLNQTTGFVYKYDEALEAFLGRTNEWVEAQKSKERHLNMETIILQENIKAWENYIALEREAQNENFKTSYSIYEKTAAELENIRARQENLEAGISRQIITEASPYAGKILQYADYINQLQVMQAQETDLLKTNQEANLLIIKDSVLREQMAAQQKMAMKDMETKHSIQLDKMKMKIAIATTGMMFSAIGAAMMQGNKEQFEMGKNLAYAGAVVSTAHGIANALSLPWPLNFMIATIVAAQGAMQIATISKQQFGSTGGGISQPSMSASGSSGLSMPTTQKPTESPVAQEKQLPTQNITINVYNPLDGKVSEEIADAIIQAINEAPNRNVTINAQAVY